MFLIFSPIVISLVVITALLSLQIAFLENKIACFSPKVFSTYSFLKDDSAGLSILSCQSFVFFFLFLLALWIYHPALSWPWNIFAEKPTDNLIGAPSHDFFPLAAFKILSWDLISENLVVRWLSEDLFGDLWGLCTPLFPDLRSF